MAIRNTIIACALFFAMFVAGLIINLCYHCGKDSDGKEKREEKAIPMKDLTKDGIRIVLIIILYR